MFLPNTPDQVIKLGWKELYVILITDDVYIDSYYESTAIIGKILVKMAIAKQRKLSRTNTSKEYLMMRAD